MVNNTCRTASNIINWSEAVKTFCIRDLYFVRVVLDSSLDLRLAFCRCLMPTMDMGKTYTAPRFFGEKSSPFLIMSSYDSMLLARNLVSPL